MNYLKESIKKNKKLLGVILAIRSSTRKCLWPFPLFHRRYAPLINSVALDIIESCNLNCYNCEASCRQAPSNNYMNLQQIKKFIDESIELKWHWEVIALRGGEPTLHPDFLSIIEIIGRYKKLFPKCEIYVLTNAFGNKTKEVLSMVPDWVKGYNILDTNKYSGRDAFMIYSSYNVAPIDLHSFKHSADFTKGCWRTERCGLGLSRYGYYPCSPGASVDRVFGFDIGIKELELINVKTLQGQMDLLCRHCGHYKEPNEQILTEKMSISWINAYEKYKKDKPTLSLY